MTRLNRLADFITGMEPPNARGLEATRTAGIDVMGCILAGAGHPTPQGARAAFGAYTGSAPVFGTGARLAAPFAALCNAVAGHVYDFDDWEEPGNTHPTVVLMPALWALAAERNASGADVATAYASGFEVIARIGRAVNFDHYNKGWHATATLGVIGAAGASARLLRLGGTQTAHALSIAISQASGYTSQFGSAAKPLQAGFAARDGVISAQLAEQGLTGQPGVLDSARGFVTMMCHDAPERLDQAIAEMNGQALADWGLAQKPYPSCGYTHRLIDCARELHGRVDLDQITSVEAELPDFHAAILPYRQPANQTEAMFSIPFCVSNTLVRGGLSLADLADEARADVRISTLIARTTVAPQPPRRPEMNYDADQPDRLAITLAGGERLEAMSAFPRGAPQKPLNAAELRAKFDTISGPVPTGAADALMAWPDADRITDILAPFSGAR